MSLHSMPCALAPCLLPLLLPPKAQLAARMFACSLSLPTLPTCCSVSACIVLVSTVLLGSCTFLARHQVVRVFTEDIQIRAATAVVVPAVATSIVGKLHLLYQGLGPHHPLPSTRRAIGSETQPPGGLKVYADHSTTPVLHAGSHAWCVMEPVSGATRVRQGTPTLPC